MSGDEYTTTTVAADHLRQLIERIERLEEEKREVAEQIKEVYAEAKGVGFDTKTLRKVIAQRKKDPDERSEEEAMLDLYMSALGMAPGSDLDETLASARKPARRPPRPPQSPKRKPKATAGFRRVDESEW